MQSHVFASRTFVALVTLCVLPFLVPAAALWQIGVADNHNTEFALAPNKSSQFKQDGFFIAGRSAPKQDWPYVHPGPFDAWAGSRSHTFTILFGLKSVPNPGECRLVLDLLDTHGAHPPKLRVTINGRAFERDTPRGAGDHTVRGEPTKGREFVWTIPFPSELLRAGDNAVEITTVSGSWVLYDAVALETPSAVDLAPVASRLAVTTLSVPPVWLNQSGRAVQPIRITARATSDDSVIIARLNDREVSRTNVAFGLHTIEATVPAFEQPTSVSLHLASQDGSALLTTNLTLGPPPLREVWILPHSHVDIGYTHRQEDIVRAQIGHLERAMQLARASATVGSSRVDLQACKLEYSIVSPK